VYFGNVTFVRLTTLLFSLLIDRHAAGDVEDDGQPRTTAALTELKADDRRIDSFI